MDYPYELDGYRLDYCPVEIEQTKKRSVDTLIDLDVDIKNLKIKLDIISPKLRVEKRNQSNTNTNTNTNIVPNSKKPKYNNLCKRCRIHSFDKCECVVQLFEDVYISGKRKKITHI
jgi:hypothetical protein